ncbi:MAG: serine/threonine-protein kinase [Anaerolineaceae bacterium]|nr:serine/threonine-protein kinase [Anaerolineaceae bacterium]
MFLQPETILKNRYRIIRLLGRGGMGAVYLAYDQNLDIQVAIKSNRDHSEESTTQFLQEARMLAALHHPNLPRVIDHFILQTNEYLVMDFVKGQDLQDILDRGETFPLDVVLSYARQLGKAVQFLHAQNPPIIHRDIKPANIKVDDKGHCVLVDFGIAKSGSTAQATSAGAKGYTPGYAPPEQYGNARTGPFSDQYSLAATLFHLITGQRPADSVQRALGKAILTPMNLLKSGLPPHFAPAFERALSIKPDQRFVSVEDFIRTLVDPAYTPIASGPSMYSTVSLVKKPTPKWLMPVIGGILAISIIGSGVIFLPKLFTPSNNNPSVAAVNTDQNNSNTSNAAEISSTASLEPTSTETAQPTPSPTITLTPTPAFESIGGGGKVAFISDRSPDGVDQIWTMNVFMNADGALTADDPRQLTFDEYDKSDIAWSPDGSKMLYTAEGNPADGHLGKEIWVLNLNKPDMPARNLTYQKGDDTGAVYSPDGEYIAFANFGRYSEVHQIYFMEPDGRNMQRIVSEYDEYSPFWTPNMDALLNVINARSHQYLYKHIWEGDIFPTPYPTPRPFDRTTTFGQLGEVTDPDLSADGTYLVYSRIEGRLYHIYSMEMRFSGAKKTLLTADNNYSRWPEWSPDGNWIVYTAYGENGSQEDVFIMTSTGLLKTNLTMHEANDRQAAWQQIANDN